MFSWFISLFLMFGNHGKAVGTPSVVLNNSGSRHFLHAEDSGSNPTAPADTDGTGGHH